MWLDGVLGVVAVAAGMGQGGWRQGGWQANVMGRYGEVIDILCGVGYVGSAGRGCVLVWRGGAAGRTGCGGRDVMERGGKNRTCGGSVRTVLAVVLCVLVGLRQ